MPTTYSLANVEDNTFLNWLFYGSYNDPRFNLVNNVSQIIPNNYDVILIDVGPRLTLASYSAICASTHVLVPTNLDRLSAETLGGFLARVKELKTKFDLPIELLGIIGTMTHNSRLRPEEEDAQGTIRDWVKKNWDAERDYLLKRHMPHKTVFSQHAGIEIAYTRSREARGVINPIGDEVTQHLWSFMPALELQNANQENTALAA
jgi:chromosome partitioning protein